MNALISLSKNTFREAIRDRILSTIFAFGFLFLLAAPLAGELSAGQSERLIMNFGLAMIHLFGIFITIFVGSRLISNEIDRKTIFLLIPKPVSRSVIICSKFFGLGAVLFCTTLLMSLVFFLLVHPSLPMILIIGFMYLSFLLLLAILLFFSSFMSPLMASVSGILFFLVGNVTFHLKALSYQFGSLFVQRFADIAYHILPNFTNLNLKNYVIYGIPYSTVHLLIITGVTILSITLFLFFATMIFSRKEFS